jgi:type IV fimbrial biogenesis protein FimT
VHTATSFERNKIATTNRRSRECGFTFVELMVTVGIAGILAAVAAPSVSEMLARQRIKTAAADIFGSLMKARSEALKRNSNVKIAPSSGNTEWQSGWAMIDTAAPTVKIEEQGQIKSITMQGPVSVTYRASGRITDTTTANFDISGSGTTLRMCVSVDISGRPSQKKTSC